MLVAKQEAGFSLSIQVGTEPQEAGKEEFAAEGFAALLQERLFWPKADIPGVGRQEPGSYERNHQYGESLRACCQRSKRALATNIR